MGNVLGFKLESNVAQDFSLTFMCVIECGRIEKNDLTTVQL
jgi:hypothetical protein